MSDDRVTKKPKRGALLWFDAEGQGRVSKTRVAIACLLMAVWVGCALSIQARTDAWFGPSLLFGLAITNVLYLVLQTRRDLRVANESQAWHRLPLIDAFLLFTAACVLAAGIGLNWRDRASELARRQEVRIAAEAIIGPHGKLERDHRSRVWLTIGDQTFDDARLDKLLDLLSYDQQRYGITRLVFSGGPGNRITSGRLAWPLVTDDSVDRLSELASLTDLHLHGTAISASQADRLLALPNLRMLGLTETVPDEVAAAALKANPGLMLQGPFPGSIWNASSATPTTHPPPPAAVSPQAPSRDSPPGSPGLGAGPLSR